ncbi:MAG: glycogen debranching protein GlgX [Alphaproteobacteria bacterium]|nr:glycogen debranching protein GlgX [Alphaproteobacteria bacterium]
MSYRLTRDRGQPEPLGVTLCEDGVNVAVVSRHATRIFISFFDAEGREELHRFALPDRLGNVHYGFIAGAAAGARYGLRAEGPWDPAQGHRFDPAKLLVDPYATRLDGAFVHHVDLTRRAAETAALVPKCIVEEAMPAADLLPQAAPCFIYELPVKAFTMRHPQVPAARRGTVAGLAEPAVLDHLVKLGVDTVELMPLAAWIDERHLPPLGLTNAWGYNPITFMAPDPRLAPGGLAEVREAVTALHAAGIRVLLDVVFNHSGESDEHGATLSLRGLDNALYYRHADGALVNDTGCGNTLALDRAPVMRLAMDAMRRWIAQTGIDGFRFDLAPVMGRRDEGFEAEAPLLAAIEQDPVLSRRVMVAEPWDVGPGGYRLGGFPARWREWNDRYRDDVRRFWRGDAGAVNALATRLAGSSDVFGPHRRPACSVNYVAAHDGFTLRDVVSHAVKNNHANGEDNRDGNGHEPVWPGGNVRALLATLFFSHGTPMLTAGDEFGRTQNGNNNAYAQDNDTTWLDWVAADHDLIAFTASLVRLRQQFPVLAGDRFLSGARDSDTGLADAQWLAAEGAIMDWQDPNAAVLGLLLAQERARVAIWVNRGDKPLRPTLPHRDGWRWTRVFCSADGPDLPARSVALYAEERTVARGLPDEALGQLAAAAGIERDWWEVDGTHHQVAPDSLRAILTALRIPHGSPDEAEASLRDLRQRRLPAVVAAGRPSPVATPAERRRRLVITGDDGQVRQIEVAPGEIPALSLPRGCHLLRDDASTDAPSLLIATPGRCHLPEDIASDHRVFGLASHLYALRHEGDGGIGDLETLRRFAGITSEIGGRYAGLNPLHHMFPADRSRASPYQPSDRRYIDPIYINIPALLQTVPSPRAAKAAERNRAAFARIEKLHHVDYVAVWLAKSKVLEQAFADMGANAELAAFIAQGGEDLRHHGIFEAKRAAEKLSEERIVYRAFLQWIAERQLAEAASQGNLYRDLALGSAFDGGEIGQAPEIYAQGVSLGAPPDPFSRAGQVWNLPPCSPLALARSDFQPLRAVLAANMRHAAALRIDHILGFMRQFWVPRGAEGRFGAYVNFPLDALIALTAIESRRQNCMVVGEDLGTIPDGLRNKLAGADILSYRVLWFERRGEDFAPRQDYPDMALACLASHDLPTFRGWREARDVAIEQGIGLIDAAEAGRRRQSRQHEIACLDAATGAAAPALEAASVAAHGFVAATPSRVMLIQVDDLANEVDPLNVPGTDQENPNWRRRLSVEVESMVRTPLATAIIDQVKKERP